MRLILFKTLKVFALAFFLCGACVNAWAQTTKPASITVQLGVKEVVIPNPDDFEEAMSQFESIKKHFTMTEAPENDTLAAHFPKADCETLRKGELGPHEFYTKISVHHVIRAEDYSAQRFASLVATFREGGQKILDINGPTMKGIMERLGKGVTELRKQETEVNLSQPVNLGEFDTRPNIYSVMLLINLKTKTAAGEITVPLLGGLSYIRVKQRLIYVYTYRKYTSKTDVEVLEEFTKRWIGQILAAN